MRGPVLIDWCNADVVPTDLGVAMTAVILAEVVVAGKSAMGAQGAATGVPDGLDVGLVARELLGRFLEAVGVDPTDALDEAVRRRASDPAVGSESGSLGARCGETVRMLTEHFAFGVRRGAKLKTLAWVWLERPKPKKARVPQPAVLAVRVSGEEEKHTLISESPDIYVTEDHYDGYPSVLVRLAAIGLDELTEILTEAWRHVAPLTRIRELDARTDG